MADDNKPITGKEKRETAGQPETLAELQRQIKSPEQGQGIRELGDAANELGKNPNTPYAAQMMEMKPEVPPENDPEGMTFMYTQFLSLLTQIGNKNPDLDMKIIRPDNFVSVVQNLSSANRETMKTKEQEKKIFVQASESLALTQLQNILQNPNSPKARQLAADWPTMIEKAKNSREGFGSRYLKRLQEKPAETLALTAVTIAGGVVTYKLIKWLFKKGWKNIRKKISDKWDSAFSFTNILGALGIVTLTGYWGHNKVEAWLYEKFGIRFGKDKITGMAQQLTKGEMPQEIIDAGKQVEAAKVAAAATGKKIKGKVQEKVKDFKEDYEHHNEYAQFITGQNPTLTIHSLLLGKIAGMDYEAFIKANEKSKLGILYDIYMKVKGVKSKKSLTDLTETDISGILGLATEYGVADLHEFFSEMLKNPDHPDFRGKNIGQVMELVYTQKNKYVDAQKVAEVKENAASPESVQAVGKLIDKIKNDPKIVLDKAFRHEFEWALAKAGLMLLMNEMGTFMVVTAKNFVPVATFVGDEVNGAFQYMADKSIKEGRAGMTALGAYLKGAGYVAWIGVPVGATMGLIQGFIKRPYAIFTTVPYHTLKGGFKGLGKSMAYPYYLGKMVYEYWADNVTPLDTLRKTYHEKTFMFEELRNKPLIRKFAETAMGKRLGLESIITKATNGKIEMTESLMKRLAVYRKLLTIEKSELYKKGGLVSINLGDHYQKLIDHINSFMSSNGWTENQFDRKFWNDKIREMVPNRRTAILLEDNHRLARMLANEEHPLRLLAGNPNKPSFGRLVEFFSGNKKLLDAFADNRFLAQDHRIITVMRGEAEMTAEGFAKLVGERAKAWKKFSGTELRLFESQPTLVSRYTELVNQLADLKKAAKLKTPGAAEDLKRAKALRTMLFKPNSAHAKFMYENLKHMDALFHDTKAFDYFMAIDRKILKSMAPFERLSLAEKFTDFGKNEKAITDLVIKAEEKLGIIGRTSQRLSQIKAGIYEKVGEKVGGAGEKMKEAVRGMRAVSLGQAHLDALAKAGNPVEVQNLLEKSGVKFEGWVYKTIAEDCKNADEVKYILESASKTSGGRYIKFIEPLTKAGRALKYLKPVGQATLGAAFFLGAGIDYYNAATTENERKRGVYLEKAGIETVAGAIDAGMLVAGTGLGTTAAYTFAAAPYLYMLEAGYESSLEAKSTEKEWAGHYDHDTLIHHWISTGKGFSAGEAYRIALTTTTMEDVEQEQRDTRKRIVTALLLQEGERFKDEGKIRLAYIEKTSQFMTGTDFEMARNTLHESRLFAGIMADRQMALEQRIASLDIGGANIVEDKYSPEKIDAATMKNLVASYAKETLSARIHPVLVRQFDSIETGDLVAYFWELDKYMADPANKESILQSEKDFRDQLQDYLFYTRKTDAAQALQKKYLQEADRMILSKQKELPQDPEVLAKARQETIAQIVKSNKKDQLTASIEHFENGEGALPESLAQDVTDTEACFALYRLASFFGYNGMQNEEKLKKFFDDAHKSAFGVYWDGKAWALNEAGWEFADEMGSNLNRGTIDKIIRGLREQPENILEHRQKAVTFSMSDIFKGQVLRMADILEQGIKEYKPREKQPEKSAPSSAPLVSEAVPEAQPALKAA